MKARALFDRLADADGQLARRIVARQNSAAAAVLPRLSNTANHGGIWMALAGATAILGDRAGRRAAMRGLVSVGIASAVANGLLKPLFPRTRPPVDPGALPSIVRRPTSSSFPSGHAATAFAFAGGVSIEAPALRVPFSVLAASVAYSRITTGVHYPSDVLAGATIGLATAAVTTKIWPRIDPTPADARLAPAWSITEPSPNGDGLVLVVNAAAGPAAHEATLDTIEGAFPNIKVVLVEDAAALDAEFAKAATDAVALGVLGGDGTIGAGAAAALEAAIPLVVFPGGTLNHFARDLGVDDLDDAIAAVKSGQLVQVDTATIDGRTSSTLRVSEATHILSKHRKVRGPDRQMARRHRRAGGCAPQWGAHRGRTQWRTSDDLDDLLRQLCLRSSGFRSFVTHPP